jgi:hypothetical protein
MPYTVTSDEEEWRVEERRQVRSSKVRRVVDSSRKETKARAKSRRRARDYDTSIIASPLAVYSSLFLCFHLTIPGFLSVSN